MTRHADPEREPFFVILSEASSLHTGEVDDATEEVAETESMLSPMTISRV